MLYQEVLNSPIVPIETPIVPENGLLLSKKIVLSLASKILLAPIVISLPVILVLPPIVSLPLLKIPPP